MHVQCAQTQAVLPGASVECGKGCEQATAASKAVGWSGTNVSCNCCGCTIEPRPFTPSFIATAFTDGLMFVIHRYTCTFNAARLSRELARPFMFAVCLYCRTLGNVCKEVPLNMSVEWCSAHVQIVAMRLFKSSSNHKLCTLPLFHITMRKHPAPWHHIWHVIISSFGRTPLSQVHSHHPVMFHSKSLWR